MRQHERERQRERRDEKGIGTEVPSRNRSQEEDTDLQREGNLGNERTRSEGDRMPRSDRGDIDR